MRVMSRTYEFFYHLNMLIQYNISIVESISILSQLDEKSEKSVATKNIALSIIQNLEKGYSFSQALALSPLLLVPHGTVCMVEAAEKAACIKELLNYICIQYDTKKSIQKEIQNALAYPLIVIFIALSGTVLLIYWKNLYLTTLSTKDIVIVIVRAVGVLSVLLLFLGVYVFVSFKEPLEYSLYFSLGVLQKAGFTFCMSLELFMGNAVTLHRGILFDAYDEISKGLPISISLRNAKLANGNIFLLLTLAEKSGSMADTCSNIANGILKTYEERKKRCLQLLEPLLLMIVGFYLVILVNGVFIPYVTDFGGML